MVGSELNRTRGKRGKTREETGARARERVPSPFPSVVSPRFVFSSIFSRALLCERLEQTT